MTLWKVLVMHYPIVVHHDAAPRVIRSCHSLPQEPVKQRLCAVQTRNCGGLTSSMFRSKMCLALNSRLAGRWHSVLPESRAVSQCLLSTPQRLSMSGSSWEAGLSKALFSMDSQ